jgi:hypothetical protein
MIGPRVLIDGLAERLVRDQHGNLWQYFSRSDRHSKLACWGIAFDLLSNSALLRRHVADGRVVLGVNHRMRDYATGRAKNLDLVLARPDGPAKKWTFADLADRYMIELNEADQAALAKLPPVPMAPVGAVLVALEAKAAMTAHIRALPRLYDELNSSHLCVHGASKQALAIGFVMVNASPTFVSGDLNRRPLEEGAVVSTEPQPKSLMRVLDKVAEIPRRSNIRETGFDGLGVVVIEGVNDGTPFVLRSDPPAPQPGDTFHYDSMILRMANEYDTSFSGI